MQQKGSHQKNKSAVGKHSGFFGQADEQSDVSSSQASLPKINTFKLADQIEQRIIHSRQGSKYSFGGGCVGQRDVFAYGSSRDMINGKV